MEPYENDDVEAVFKAHEQQAHAEYLSAMFIQLEQITHLDMYVPANWEAPGAKLGQTIRTKLEALDGNDHA